MTMAQLKRLAVRANKARTIGEWLDLMGRIDRHATTRQWNKLTGGATVRVGNHKRRPPR